VCEEEGVQGVCYLRMRRVCVSNELADLFPRLGKITQSFYMLESISGTVDNS
jgi:hypothetical protein